MRKYVDVGKFGAEHRVTKTFFGYQVWEWCGYNCVWRPYFKVSSFKAWLIAIGRARRVKAFGVPFLVSYPGNKIRIGCTELTQNEIKQIRSL